MMAWIKIAVIVSGLALADSLDDEIMANLDFAMSLEVIEETPQQDFDQWSDLELVAQDLKNAKNDKRSQP